MARTSRLLDLDGTNAVTAMLGPTNTGKTHRAIERMLKHRSGMIGLPLRLLAREVYDRVRAAKGDGAVALVTGEEKRIPANPRYFVCTVEAMPLDVPVSFLAVDEVQLAGDRYRGHVFTDRLLHARGLVETWFLGSDTIAPLLGKLVRTVAVERQSRFSKLTYAGTHKVTALPKRSALVGFSAEQVYALAERLRARHGGAAVVFGALSPRTRNAQVALFQSGEVPYLVATDAIGMGLNLDLDHVAFAALRKFDGKGHRALSHSELAQIAGRAGRFRRDGTFGALNQVGELEPEVVRALESHRFEPLRRLYYRSSDLAFDSIEVLLAGLARHPPADFLVRMRDAEDHESLEHLAARPEVRARATEAPGVYLLWEVCRIPDFRKTLTDAHVDLLEQIFVHLTDSGRLPEEWVARRIEHLDDATGDLDALMTRLAYIRTWNYVTHRRDWVDEAHGWQERTGAIEDRLSDALHEQLTKRFVDRRAMVLTAGRSVHGEGLVDDDGVVRAGPQRVGVLEGLNFRADPEVARDKMLLKQVHKAVSRRVAARVELLVRARSPSIDLGSGGELLWKGAPIAHLTMGKSLLQPSLRVRRHELVDAADRRRLEQALQRWVRERVSELTAHFDPDRDPRLSPAARGLLYQIEQGLGTVETRALPVPLSKLDEADRRGLARYGLRFGTESVFSRPLLKPRHVQLRAALFGVWNGLDPLPALPADGCGSFALDPAIPPAFFPAVGFAPRGPRAIRVDLLERVAARLRKLARKGPFDLPHDVQSWIGCGLEDLEAILQAMGYRRLGGEAPRFVRRPADRDGRPARPHRSAARSA